MNVRKRRGCILACMLLLCAAANLATILGALQTPWLGISVMPADTSDGLIARASSAGPARLLGEQARLLDLSTYTASNAIRLMPVDVTADPDRFASYAEVDAFFARQDHLRALLDVPLMMNWKDTDGTIRQAIATPGSRPLASLPAVFWIRQLAASLALLACAIPLMRGSAPHATLTLLAGMGITLAVFPASLYGARELALSASTFRTLWALNHAGATLFGCALIALLARTPRPLCPPHVLTLIIAAFLAWLAADLARLVGNPDWGYRVPLLLQVGIAAGLGIAQGVAWRRKTRY